MLRNLISFSQRCLCATGFGIPRGFSCVAVSCTFQVPTDTRHCFSVSGIALASKMCEQLHLWPEICLVLLTGSLLFRFGRCPLSLYASFRNWCLPTFTNTRPVALVAGICQPWLCCYSGHVAVFFSDVFPS